MRISAALLLLVALVSACVEDDGQASVGSADASDAGSGDVTLEDGTGADTDVGRAADSRADGTPDAVDSAPEVLDDLDSDLARDTTAGEDSSDSGPSDLSDVHDDLADTGDAGDASDTDTTEPRPLPTFPQLDDVVDAFRGSVPAWVAFIYVQLDGGDPRFQWAAYGDTADRTDFWPASTIKIYTVTATLELLKDYGVSLDAVASFYHRSGDSWVFDTSRSFRDIIFDVFDYSSNSDYTLLLRFCGLDWLNTEFFVADNGFSETALMRGYVTDRPWVYNRTEGQRILIEDGDVSIERSHEWSGTSYADRMGCTVYNGTGTGNCSSPRDMAEHMRRLMFHEQIPAAERFDVRLADLDWVRYGDDEPVLNDRESSWADGILRALPDALYYHKAGRVTDYALDLHYVEDAASDTRYVAAIATESTATTTYDKLSEEIARMASTPYSYVHLDYLTDDVNPVEADLMVYSAEPGTLELIIKPYEQDPDLSWGWTVLAGTTVEVSAGTAWYAVASDCLSADARYHVRGRFTPTVDLPVAYSDLHYVIVDADVPCP